MTRHGKPTKSLPLYITFDHCLSLFSVILKKTMMKAAYEGINLLHSVLPGSTATLMELGAGNEVEAVGGNTAYWHVQFCFLIYLRSLS